MLIFGLDVGTTSIGFAAVELNEPGAQGKILRLGSRIFPEARDPDGTPLNQQRRVKRMARRQLRRRKDRRRGLNEALLEACLLPAFGNKDWPIAMAADPYMLRKRGLTEALDPYELGRALYHLAKRRHFKGRNLEASEENLEQAPDKSTKESLEEKEAKTGSEATHKILKVENKTLGAWLMDKPAKERKRGIHAKREDVHDEFEKLWAAQAAYHPALKEPSFKVQIETAIFAQRPVFWRKNTLGRCRLEPGAELCPKGSWLSQQRRMLEKLNNLAIAGGNGRPLDNSDTRKTPDTKFHVMGKRA